MAESGKERLDLTGLPGEQLRAGVGLLLGALASTFGAFILGEYQFDGVLPVFAGVLFGLVVAELVVEVGRRRTYLVAFATGVIAGGGLLWAGYISAGEGLDPIPGGAWIAAVVGLVTGVLRTLDLGALRSR